jgi:hypothetical protein
MICSTGITLLKSGSLVPEMVSAQAAHVRHGRTGNPVQSKPPRLGPSAVESSLFFELARNASTERIECQPKKHYFK